MLSSKANKSKGKEADGRTEVHLLLLAKYPTPGRAKTRLIPALGPTTAVHLHRRMTESAVNAARSLRREMPLTITISFTGASKQDFRAWLGTDLTYAAQPAGDLGVRLQKSFARAFRNGACRVVAVGADIPGLSAEILHQAFAHLHTQPVTLGPAADGGYYLIGMNQFFPSLFSGIDWGTETVCAQTRAAIAREKQTVIDLPQLNDVDRPEDLPPLKNDPRFADVLSHAPKISVIIPTLNEAETIIPTLDRIRTDPDVEAIVVDGGSTDGTQKISEQHGAVMQQNLNGRGAQQNTGAAIAGGRYLLFLHADTLLPPGYADLIRQALAPPSTVAGAFRFQVPDAGPAMRLVMWGTHLRSSLFQWPYGDQGLFMEKRVFQELGGFADMPIMEDFELVQRLRRRGRIVTLNSPVQTSARRWHEQGVLKTTLCNQCMIAGFYLGIAPQRLFRFYRRRPNT